MNLRLVSKYKSIQKLIVPTDLSKFSLLTGVNGSGKTHILEAIKSNNIQVFSSGQQISSDEILMVKFNELTVKGNDSYSSQNALQVCNQLVDHFNNWKAAFERDQRFTAPGEDRKTAFLRYIERYRNSNDKNIENIINSIIHTLKHEESTDLDRITRQHFWKNIFDPNTSSSDINFFEHNFAQLFAEYNISLMKQRFYKFLNDNRYPDAPNVDEDRLNSLEQNKPWDFVNSVLKSAKFNFEVMPPDFLEADEFSYKIHLKKKTTGATVYFDELSTGEKVLFALALVRYKAEKRTQKFPKLILLDEPDAPLHPEMNKSLLDVIQNVFVGEYETKVIMTTHAPASVAFAPENNIFVVKNVSTPEQSTQILLSGKQNALQSLSSGFIAMTEEESEARVKIEVSSSSMPLLLVEGVTDKLIIERAWKKIREGRMPFKVIDCSTKEEIRKKIDAVSVADQEDRNIVGLFDFDSAFNTFKGLTGKRDGKEVFSEIKGEEKKGLHRQRRNGSNKITALLLPVPQYRPEYASKTLAGNSMLEIELLFKDEVLSIKDNLGETTLPGGNVIKTFKGDKVRFYENVVKDLKKEDFTGFEQLIVSITKFLNV